MKLVLLSLALSALASCSAHPAVLVADFAEASPPAPDLPVEVSFMWSLKSASVTNDVTIGKADADWKYHGACFFGADTRYLMGLAPWKTSIKAAPDVKDYLALADSYVQGLKISSGKDWGVDEAHASKGHCWNSTNQVWEECPVIGPEPPKSYAFQLLKKSGSGYVPYFDYSKVANPAATVNINYYVIVQLQ
jgi:hypothetical protein